MIKKGFDIEKFKLNLKQKFAGKSNIQTDDFVLEICRMLSEYVNDSHFSFIMRDKFLYKPSAPKIIAFTKVYVKKIEDEYVVKEDEWSEAGKIIFITDKNTSSAAEWAILQFKEVFDEQVFVIGTNTGGVLEFCNIFNMFLPNSGIKVRFGNIKYLEVRDFYPEYHGETFGIFPDYWSVSKDLNETIYKITGDKKMKRKLKNFL